MMIKTIINSKREKPDVLAINLAPRHKAQRHRKRKELIPSSMTPQFGADGDQITFRFRWVNVVANLVQMPSNVINALNGSSARARRADNVVHVITRWRIGLTVVDIRAAKLGACGSQIGRASCRERVWGSVGVGVG